MFSAAQPQPSTPSGIAPEPGHLPHTHRPSTIQEEETLSSQVCTEDSVQLVDGLQRKRPPNDTHVFRKSKQLKTPDHKDVTSLRASAALRKPRIIRRADENAPVSENATILGKRLFSEGEVNPAKKTKVFVEQNMSEQNKEPTQQSFLHQKSRERFEAARRRQVRRDQFQKEFMEERYLHYRNMQPVERETEKVCSTSESVDVSPPPQSPSPPIPQKTPKKEPSDAAPESTPVLRRSSRKAARKAMDSIKKQCTPKRASASRPTLSQLEMSKRIEKRTLEYREQMCREENQSTSREDVRLRILPLIKKRAKRCRGSPVAFLREFFPECKLPPHPSRGEIRKAFRRALAKFHPDSRKSKESLEDLVTSEEIYKLLSDIREKVL